MKDEKSVSLQKRIKSDGTWTIIVTAMLGMISVFSLIGAVAKMVDPKEGQQSFAIDLGNTVAIGLIFVAFICLSVMLVEIKKSGKPFSKANINRLRVMAVLVILAGVLPDVVTSLAGMFDATAIFQLEIGFEDFVLMLLGVVIGIISEIFYYGYQLQQDMDSIA